MIWQRRGTLPHWVIVATLSVCCIVNSWENPRISRCGTVSGRGAAALGYVMDWGSGKQPLPIGDWCASCLPFSFLFIVCVWVGTPQYAGGDLVRIVRWTELRYDCCCATGLTDRSVSGSDKCHVGSENAVRRHTHYIVRNVYEREDV